MTQPNEQTREKKVYHRLSPVSHSDVMKYAVCCVRKGKRFEFKDSSGRSHGDFEKDNFVSRAPTYAIGAVKILEHWYWILEEQTDL